MKFHFRTVCVVLSAILCLTAVSGIGSVSAETEDFKEAQIENEFVPMLSNDRCSLFCNTQNGQIMLSSKESDLKYYSNPQDAQSNPELKGSGRTAALSQLIIRLLDKQGNETLINSLVESVNKNGLKVSVNNSKIQCVYRFPDYKISITVYYYLQDDRLIADIPTREIKTVKSEQYMTEIQLLPYFGAASVSDEGYIIVPDGCGCMIPFHSKKIPAYSQLLYGSDRGKKENGSLVEEQPALLPMVASCFTNHNGSTGGLLTYVESGASLATAYASAEATDNCYNTAGFGFTYRAWDQVTMMDQTSNATKLLMCEKNPVSYQNYSLSYTILSADDSNLIGFASKVRDRVFSGHEIPSVKDNDLPVYIQTYLSVRKTKYFLGIPYNGNEKLTDLDDCENMIDDFSGVPVVMSLSGIDSDGAVGGKIDRKLSVIGSVGSMSELKTFIEKVNNTGGSAYPVAEFTEFTKGNRNNRVMSVANLAIEHYFYNYGNSEKISSYGKTYLLKNRSIVDNVSAWADSAADLGIKTCAPFTLSNSPYRSGAEFGADREATSKIFTEAFEQLEKDQLSILTEAAAAYAIPYSERIQSMPVSSSGFAACGSEIPFLQLVLHGTVSYSMPSINLSGSYDYDFLKAIETGSSLNFSFTGADYSKLKESPLDRLNGADYSLWKDKAVSDAKELSDIMQGTAKVKINDYQILSEDVRYVSYANGSSFIINYGNTSFTYNDSVIEPMSYLKANGGEAE